MWPLLLEKAFAKLKGSYQALSGGLPLDAMKAMTGYEGERITLSSSSAAASSDAAFKKLHIYSNAGCLLAAGTKGVDQSLVVGRKAVGGSLVGGHAYSILEIKTPSLTSSKVRLLKLRNPWGTFEWKGDWGDDSVLWSTHPGVAFEIGRPARSDD
eukprot:gene27975-36861_t